MEVEIRNVPPEDFDVLLEELEDVFDVMIEESDRHKDLWKTKKFHIKYEIDKE